MWESVTKDGVPGKVLLVHHEKHIARSIQTNLMRHGHKVVLITSCDEALTKLSEDTFDAVIIDAALPPGRCAAALRELSALPNMSNVPAWVLGAEEQDHEALHGLDLHPLHILSKKP